MSKKIISSKLNMEEVFWFALCIGITCMELILKHRFKIEFSEQGTVAGVLFGITSGILSLMGLTAIFVSLNSQHKIHRCREALWNMKSASQSDENPASISKTMNSAVKEYSIIFQNEEPFMNVVITICQWGIIFVVVSWSSFIGFIDLNSIEMCLLVLATWFGVYILLHFHNVISKLTDIEFVGELKPVKDLLHVEKEQKVQSLYLLGQSLQIKNKVKFDSKCMPSTDIEVWGKLITPISHFQLKLAYVEVKLRSKSGEEQESIPRHPDEPFVVEFPESRFEDIVKNWRETGESFEFPLFDIRQVEKPKKVFNNRLLEVPYGADEIDMIFKVSKIPLVSREGASLDPTTAYTYIQEAAERSKVVFSMRYTIPFVANTESYKGVIGYESDAYWFTYQA